MITNIARSYVFSERENAHEDGKIQPTQRGDIEVPYDQKRPPDSRDYIQ